MLIKLNKSAQWSGKSYRAGSKHDISDALADKLIRRGLAEKFVQEAEEKVEDATASE